MKNLYLRYTYLIYVKKWLKYKLFSEIKEKEESELPQDVLENLSKNEVLSFVEKELETALKFGAKIIEYNSNLYPRALKNIKNPPPVLYVKGNYFGKNKAFAVVGSRRATPYGVKVSYNLGYELGLRKITVVSGMAYGIDSRAHRGCLDAKGNTFAVLGCGVDVIYPRQNRKLKEEIEENGATLSEFPFSTEPLSTNFPVRNRIISAISDLVIVVEATEKSGALITADYALDQGKEVYAVPGSIYSELSKGTNSLIKHGANLFEHISDLFPTDSMKETEFNLFKEELAITEKEKMILRLIDEERGINLNEIILKSELKVNDVMATLTGLEIKGLIEEVNGLYIRK